MMHHSETEPVVPRARSSGGLVSQRVQMYEKPTSMNTNGEPQNAQLKHRQQDSFHVSNFQPPSRPQSFCRASSRSRANSRSRAATRCRPSRFIPSTKPVAAEVETPELNSKSPSKMVVQDIRQDHIDAILKGEDAWATIDDRDEIAATRATPVRQNRGADAFEAFQPFVDQPFDSSGFEKIPRAISPLAIQETRQDPSTQSNTVKEPTVKEPTEERKPVDGSGLHTLAEDACVPQAQVSPRKKTSSKATTTEPVRPQPKSPVAKSKSSQSQQDFTGCALIESGVQYYSEGDFGKALKAFSTALKTQRLNNKKDDIHVALTLSNLGSVYLQQNDLVEAEKVLLESLDIKRKLAPQMVVADTLNNLGNCMNLRGELEASLIFYEDALDDSRTKKGKPYDEINALFNIGRLEIQRQHWTKAMMALNEACGMAKEVYGTNHPFVAQTLDLMGFAQLSTSKLDAAMVSFTGALAIYRRLHGPMHFEVANSLFNVGMVREAKGELNDSWEAYTTARDLYSRIGTLSDHPGFAAVMRSIASVEKAIQARERAAAKKSRNIKKTKKQERVTISGVEV